ncbi:hypothetical protein A2765_02655 [Candidatus Kaiserbacteria bacterium RIFCSPHIGHO2_01_FULL_56_24]|uniref:Uncharacterized protein n=1 Tax=Candidatus Kaiserbacteria bacterium RIFCSPHIGHO2_01_FULL_56_24 TaxID=1798487 RepID=A0A1F6DAY0_9BACT|nr:MAG: hypothetical protein A2765_02655 [Candidatus Kaiserbacteria bacterium RIFCSPHIGHO2_01_FULL_56_24]
MKWKVPPIIKISEALGAVADERIEVTGNSARIYSSSGNKFYTVTYDSAAQEIMANDNGSYWKEYLGYPTIAFLFKVGVLPYDENIGKMLKGIKWKDINQRFKNNFERTLDFILGTKTEDEKKKLETFVNSIDVKIRKLNLKMLGDKAQPPEGY